MNFAEHPKAILKFAKSEEGSGKDSGPLIIVNIFQMAKAVVAHSYLTNKKSQTTIAIAKIL